jgi:hypothetical protein
MTIVQISRDPFARTTLVREVCDYAIRYRCEWCGAIRAKQSANVVIGTTCKHMFRYGTQRDDRGGTYWHPGEFCSKACHDSYHRS